MVQSVVKTVTTGFLKALSIVKLTGRSTQVSYRCNLAKLQSYLSSCNLNNRQTPQLATPNPTTHLLLLPGCESVGPSVPAQARKVVTITFTSYHAL